MMERRDFVWHSNGLRLHGVEWGPPRGQPVIMLHGIRGYAQTFEGLAQALQPTMRVISFDQRGRGESDWDPSRNYYTDAYVADLISLTEHLGLERFALLGHSMGGINAIVYAAQHPLRVTRLLIEDAGPGVFEGSPGAMRIQHELANTPAHFESWEVATEFMRALRPTVTEQARQQRLRNMLKQDASGGFTWQYDHAGIAATRLAPDPARIVDLAGFVKRLQCPTLVLRGGRSDYLQPEMAQAMCDANAKVRWTQVDDAGHYIHDDQPQAVAALAREFFLT